MPAQELSRVMQIGEWTVHPALDSISRGSETQKLEPRAMRLLLCLANAAGEVVSIDRLLTEVWAGVVVGSASVYEAVSQRDLPARIKCATRWRVDTRSPCSIAANNRTSGRAKSRN